MTQFNGTGPQGAGPMTGRGRGYCMGYVGPDTRFDRGFCRSGARSQWYRCHVAGLPRRSGWITCTTPVAPVFAPPLSGEQELAFLKEQAECLENSLERIKKRIEELEKKD